ncbi:hypothetical protein [Chitinophaga sancti]|uniref:Uncharacterized protein n=1 Tax=Chitinophaga sancti TaxID=1004 RepID=A0ABZ0XHD8_9BACT|nr:hypothetical protein [Chitinophaga sancti]WQD64311.1 hypothetical protein U0033_07880 [Chitinophaga sancti]WQG90065.1 hypothetical protein SR876_01040 [Chitinophaga sancti]
MDHARKSGRAVPGNFLVDGNGKVIAKGLRKDDLQEKLAALLK